jgi:hypothetical protein
LKFPSPPGGKLKPEALDPDEIKGLLPDFTLYKSRRKISCKFHEPLVSGMNGHRHFQDFDSVFTKCAAPI